MSCMGQEGEKLMALRKREIRTIKTGGRKNSAPNLDDRDTLLAGQFVCDDSLWVKYFLNGFLYFFLKNNMIVCYSCFSLVNYS